MEEICVLQVVDFVEDIDRNDVYLFTELEKAQKKLKHFRAEFLAYCDLTDLVIDCDDPNFFVAYKKGCYNDNHFILKIEKKEIL